MIVLNAELWKKIERKEDDGKRKKERRREKNYFDMNILEENEYS
jgi:hypothetical protein